MSAREALAHSRTAAILSPTATHRAGRAGCVVALAVALLAMAMSAAVFVPILGAYFHGDDFVHLFQIANYDLGTNLIIPHAGHVYAVRNFVFYACWWAFGMEPAGYYAVALATHLVNVALLFAVIRRLTGRTALAGFGAALWGACPLHAGVLNWYSVYGHALAGTMLLLILVRLAALVRSGETLRRREGWVWYALALVGTTCFGVGIAVAMVLPWVIWLWLPHRSVWWRPPLASLVVVVPLLYVVLLCIYAHAWGDDGSVVSWASLAGFIGIWLPLALWEVSMFGVTFLLLGPWSAGELGRGIPLDAWLAVGSVVIIALVAVAATDRRPRRPLLACALLAVATYGIIMAGRGAFFVDAPEFLHLATRYHYVPLIPVTIALCIGLQSAAERLQVPRRVAAAAFALWITAWSIRIATLPAWIDTWSEEHAHVEQLVDTVRTLAAAAPPGEPVYIRNRMFQPVLVPSSRPSFANWAGAFTLYFPSGTVDGVRVYFVERNETLRAINATGVPIGRLLIDPADVPRGTKIH